jgi:hypothetical protein
MQKSGTTISGLKFRNIMLRPSSLGVEVRGSTFLWIGGSTVYSNTKQTPQKTESTRTLYYYETYIQDVTSCGLTYIHRVTFYSWQYGDAASFQNPQNTGIPSAINLVSSVLRFQL